MSRAHSKGSFCYAILAATRAAGFSRMHYRDTGAGTYHLRDTGADHNLRDTGAHDHLRGSGRADHDDGRSYSVSFYALFVSWPNAGRLRRPRSAGLRHDQISTD